MGRLKGWRLWYMVSVVVLCASLSIPFIVANVFIDGSGKRHFGPTPIWGMALALVCFGVATTHVVAAICVIFERLRRIREIKAKLPEDQAGVGNE